MTSARLIVGLGLLGSLAGCRGAAQSKSGPDARALDAGATLDTGPFGGDIGDAISPPIEAGADADLQDASASDAVDASAPPLAAICPSLTEGALTDVIFTARSGQDLVNVRRNGEQATVARFDAVPLSRWLAREQGYLLAEGMWQVPDGTTMPDSIYQYIMLDRAGAERWRVTRQLPIWSYRSALWPDARGGATISIIDANTNAVNGVVFDPDGTAHELDGLPLDAADAQGWAPVALTLEQVPWGFVRAATGERRPARIPFARSDLPPVVKNGRLLYLGLEAGQLLAVIETPDGASRFPLGAATLADLGVTATDAGAAFTVNGRPRWLALAETQRVVEAGPYPDDVPDVLGLLVNGDWGLVRTGGKPIWIVNLRTGAVRRGPALPDSSYFAIAGKWAFGVGHGTGYATWRLDLETGDSLPLDYTQAAPLRVFDSSLCVGYTTPAPLPDGRLPVALRDDQVSGIFVANQNVAPWQRIGRSVTGVDAVVPERLGDTWIIRAVRNTRLSCKTPWDAPPLTGEQPLAGDSLQLVSSDGGAPIIFQTDRQASPAVTLPSRQDMTFHPSGKCVFIRGRIHDVPTGKSVDLAPADLVTWW